MKDNALQKSAQNMYSPMNNYKTITHVMYTKAKKLSIAIDGRQPLRQTPQ